MKNIHTSWFILVAMIVLILLISGVSWAVWASVSPASAQALTDRAAQLLGSGFSYQGYLVEKDIPAAGSYDFHFELFDAETEGVSLGVVTLDDIPVDDGLFNVSLDFGSREWFFHPPGGEAASFSCALRHVRRRGWKNSLDGCG